MHQVSSASSLHSLLVCPRGHSVSTTQPPQQLSLPEAWPLLKDRFDAIKNDYGKIELLNTRQKTVVHKQVPSNDRSAAVLVLLLSVQGQPSLLFTRRSANLSDDASEISFPGGHFEKEHDNNLTDTAVREAVEELYGESDASKQEQILQDFRKQVHVLGHGMPLPSIRGVPVTPVLAAMLEQDFTEPVTDIWPGGRSEVDLVFTISLQDLVQAETVHTLPKNRLGFVSNEAPIFPTMYGYIWGTTGYILRPILQQLLRPVFFADPSMPR
jgi:8-oxo-dGTP pyrophosphatase MutT (NUDIX family)